MSPFKLLQPALWLFLLTTAVAGYIFSMIAWSSFELSVSDLYGYLFAFDSNSVEHQLLATLRAPRALASFLIGANLAIAGAIMQNLTHNPLSSPTILGINAGAACFITAASIGVIGLAQLPTTVNALLGGTLSGVLVMLLGGFFSTRSHPLKIILAGIAINALFVGLTRTSVILADDSAYGVSWLAGSVAYIGWREWQSLWPISLVGCALAIYSIRGLNMLTLGDEVAKGLGLNIQLTRIIACISALLLTTVSVAVAGPIAFIGLLAPHIAKILVGNNFIFLLPACALLGGSFLIWADGFSRAIVFPAETPVGVMTALIGSPYFIALSLRSRLSHAL
ncbi:FecCD family ABC transporter permease [Spartinivicinus poritis]|uniref:Iron chelate uptake ABC transporter family permease subunit n=1 Tax=Spartinivicinus poritis TaxID=2994640 RepID=A0ABT5U9T0_9GAMM|nr:iron chelate uptake ABC transporter family permease subunit [Spartinivicinus sp. A2-2]MDE1463119.1 iron chelate uptake ABC transporter family permease subunit [Spartinivicinus sp. A2-2]